MKRMKNKNIVNVKVKVKVNLKVEVKAVKVNLNDFRKYISILKWFLKLYENWIKFKDFKLINLLPNFKFCKILLFEIIFNKTQFHVENKWKAINNKPPFSRTNHFREI